MENELQTVIERFDARRVAGERAIGHWRDALERAVERHNWPGVEQTAREIDRLEHEHKVWARVITELRELEPTNPVLASLEAQ